MNMTTIKVVSSMFKKHKLFLLMVVVIEIYRFKIVHFLLIFGLWNRDHVTGSLQTWCAYSLYLHPSCNKIAENLLKSGRSIKFTRSISFTQGEHHQLSIKTKNKFVVSGHSLQDFNHLRYLAS